jgi:hypothetical protein
VLLDPGGPRLRHAILFTCQSCAYNTCKSWNRSYSAVVVSSSNDASRDVAGRAAAEVAH